MLIFQISELYKELHYCCKSCLKKSLCMFPILRLILCFLHFPKFPSSLQPRIKVMMYAANPFQAEYQGCNSGEVICCHS